MERVRRVFLNFFTTLYFLSKSLAKIHPTHFSYLIAFLRDQIENSSLVELKCAEDSIRQIKEILQPLNCETIRVGSAGDGGYYIVDFLQPTYIVSCGLAHNIDFEIDMVSRGCSILAFDPTIPEITHIKNFKHVRQWIARSGFHALWNLNEMVEKYSLPDGILLKLDIEGSEWEFLKQSTNSLHLVDLLIVEFHNFRLLSNREFREVAMKVLEEISETFSVIACESNNYANMVNFGSGFIPDVIQVTFLSKKHLRKLSRFTQDRYSQSGVQNNPNALPIPNLPFTFPLSQTLR